MQSLELQNDESRALSALHGLGDVELEAGNFAAARVAYRRLLESSVQLQIWRSAAWGLAGLAALAAAERNAERAWRLWGASEVLFERRGLPAGAASSPRYRVRLDALDEQPRARALEAGRTLPLEDAVALALSVDST